MVREALLDSQGSRPGKAPAAAAAPASAVVGGVRGASGCAARWWRDAPAPATPATGAAQPLRHIGLYGYRAGFLRSFPQLRASPLEQVESLEQLRVLWHGHRIAVHITPTAPGAGVDTPADLERVRRLFKS